MLLDLFLCYVWVGGNLYYDEILGIVGYAESAESFTNLPASE